MDAYKCSKSGVCPNLSTYINNMASIDKYAQEIYRIRAEINVCTKVQQYLTDLTKEFNSVQRPKEEIESLSKEEILQEIEKFSINRYSLEAINKLNESLQYKLSHFLKLSNDLQRKILRDQAHKNHL